MFTMRLIMKPPDHNPAAPAQRSLMPISVVHKRLINVGLTKYKTIPRIPGEGSGLSL
jgi:hypothetical protein